MNQELKERLVQPLPPIWPPGAPVTVTNAGVCGEIFWTMGSFRSCRKGFFYKYFGAQRKKDGGGPQIWGQWVAPLPLLVGYNSL